MLLTIGYLVFSKNSGVQIDSITSEDPADYPYLSKRIFLEKPNDTLINFLPLREEVRATVKPYGDTFGVYFEYLPTGTSIGINEKVDFESASLFKIPMIMAYYRGQERRGTDKDIVETIKSEDVSKDYGSLWQRGAGAKVPLGEAIKYAIIESDNTAINLIKRHVEQDDVLAVYEGLDIDLLMSDEKRVLITTKGFSSLLKSLFFASVVSKENSEHILEYMTQVQFKDALAAGVPSDIKVAHKIGEINSELYMDCGIVYVPNRPYTLCMVSASDSDEAARRMRDLSSKIYEFVSSQP